MSATAAPPQGQIGRVWTRFRRHRLALAGAFVVALLMASALFAPAFAPQDPTLLDTALFAHGRSVFAPDMQLASLDHAMWFHGPFRADDWLLYDQDSPFSGGSRGFCRGELWTRDGRLVASTTQEGLMRRTEAGTRGTPG